MKCAHRQSQFPIPVVKMKTKTIDLLMRKHNLIVFGWALDIVWCYLLDDRHDLVVAITNRLPA